MGVKVGYLLKSYTHARDVLLKPEVLPAERFVT